MSTDMELGLLAAGGGGGLSSDASAPDSTNHPPDFTHLEGRAVSADFLRRFRLEKVTYELKVRATDAAIPLLNSQIKKRTLEVKALEGTQEVGAVEDSEEGRKQHENNLTNAKRWLVWLTEDLAKRKAEPYVTARDVHRYIVKAETDDLLCRYCELPGMAEQKDPETGMHYFGDADHFFSYNWDSPFDDVVDAICAHSCRRVAAGKSPGYYFIDNFAMSQHYKTSEQEAANKAADLDYNTHQGATAPIWPDEQWKMWGKSSTACPACPNCPGPWDKCYECPCDSCRNGCYDMTDWGRRKELLAEPLIRRGERAGASRQEVNDAQNDHDKLIALIMEKEGVVDRSALHAELSEAAEQHRLTAKIHGFERVIQHTAQKANARLAAEGGELEPATVMLMEPYYQPRAPTRVWCLFEGRATLLYGGKLEGIVGPAQQSDLRINLNEKFSKLEAIVSSLDSLTADATGEDDRIKIFSAISELPGGHAELDETLQDALLEWLCDAADQVIYRTNPRRPPLDSVAMALEVEELGEGTWFGSDSCCCRYPSGAKLTALLERLPRLPPLMVMLTGLMWTSCFLVLGVWWSVEEAGSGWGWLVLVLFFGGNFVGDLGARLIKHQERRQLRRPPLFGDWVTRHADDAGFLKKERIFMVFLTVCLPAALWWAVDWRMALMALPVGFAAVFAVQVPLYQAQSNATDRAVLRTRAGWLRLRTGDAEGAAEQLQEAHAELLESIGRHNELQSWVVAAAQIRALCEAGREAEAAEVRAEVGRNPASGGYWVGPEWSLLRAGAAAAARAPDAEVLTLLEEAVDVGCWLPAGSRPLDRIKLWRDGYPGRTEGGLPEWEEFLGRMAMGVTNGADAEEAEVLRRWQAYRDKTIKLARARVAKFKGEGADKSLSDALETRGLPTEVGGVEELAAQRARLLASLFEHPAWAYSDDVAVAAVAAIQARQLVSADDAGTTSLADEIREGIKEQREAARTRKAKRRNRLHQINDRIAQSGGDMSGSPDADALRALRARCKATRGQIARDDITGAIEELQACLVVAQELGDRESESAIQQLLPQTQQLLQMQRSAGSDGGASARDGMTGNNGMSDDEALVVALAASMDDS
eukprot:COSAG05_NODE_223_length_13640_cov_1551.628979_1_plen_1104_part_00